MKILIVGSGKTGYFLARSFLAKGHQVILVNRDEEECVRLARRLRATVVRGDGSDPAVLEEAGAAGADVVLAVTPNDQDNLVVCQLAALRFSVPRTLAIVNDPDHEVVFKKLGVEAIATTRVIANLIEQRTALSEITNLVPMEEGKVHLAELRLTEESPAAGKVITDLHLPADALLACIVRAGETIVPRGPSRLEAGDRVILLTTPDSHGAALRAILGEGHDRA